MNDYRVVSQNHRFVIMLGGAGVIHPALHKARSCAVGWAGCKIDVQEAVNKDFNFLQANFGAPIKVEPWHCHTLDTQLLRA